MNPAAIGGRAMLVHAGALGDFVLATRVIEALLLHGAAGVTILGRPHVAELAIVGGQADRVLDFEAGGFHTLFDPDLDLSGRVAEDLAGHVLTINMAAPGHEVFARRLSDATQGRVVDIDPRPREGLIEHISDQWLDDLARLGMGGSIGPPTIRVASSISRGRVIVHPGSGGARKCWPIDQFVALLLELRRRGKDAAFLIGGVERESWSAGDLNRLASVAPLIEGKPVAEVAILLASAEHVVANDSGIAHLAAAVGTPLTVIFGPTDPRVWRPLGTNVSVVAADPWPGVAAVLASIEAPPPRR